MFEYTRFESIPDGEEKLRYLKKCISVSDSRKKYAESLKLRFMYIRESVLNDDNFRAVIMFPEYMAMFNEHPEQHDCLSFMTAFRWIMDKLTDYYQVSGKNIEKYFEKYKEYCLGFGFSLRSYYHLRIKHCFASAPEQVPEYLALFRKAESDELCSCKACELNTEIITELQFGNEVKAVGKLTTMMQRNITCSDVPQITYGKFIEHFTKLGNLDEADHYADLLMPMAVSINFLGEISDILLLKSYTSPNDAYNIFCKYLEMFIKVKNPRMKFLFANASARFFENINRDENEEISMKLPRTFELYNEDNLYDPDIMFAYFNDIASELAEKFDKNNHNTLYNDILNAEYPSEPVKELSLPEHGTASRIPFSVAVPFCSEESVPSPEQITALLKTVPDIEFNDISSRDSDTIILCGYNNYIDTNFICKINICEPEDLDEYRPLHRLPKGAFETVVNECKQIILISTLFHKGTENPETTALFQFANVLNTDNSPVILCVTNGTMFSSDWVAFHTKGRLPLFDKYMYNVHVYPSVTDETRFDVITSGLAQQGSRELAVLNAEEEDLEFISRVISQIADLICGYTELRDEGFKTGFGVVYNDESEVQFSWLPVEKAYPDNFTLTERDLAVPLLYLSADDAENDKGYFINEIPEEVRVRTDFRNSIKSLRIEAVLSRRNFPYIAEAFRKYDECELICGFNVPVPAESNSSYDTDEVYIKVEDISDDYSEVTGKVTIESELIPEYINGNIITLFTENMMFWRFEYQGEYFSADDTYIFK